MHRYEKDRRDRSRRKDRHHPRQRERSRSRSKSCSLEDLSAKLEDGGVHRGRVVSVVQFGCFVQLEGCRKREGLVHISQLSREGRVNNTNDILSRGQKVMVKILRITEDKISLSMKDVDQVTGEDLNPLLQSVNTREDDKYFCNPDRPISNIGTLKDDDSKKRIQRLSSPEKWEIKQMIAASCIDKRDLTEFNI